MSRTSTKLAVFALAALSACAKPQHALTYRLSLTVSDNGRPVSGSVVRSEDWTANQIGGDNVPLQENTRGDAIVLPVRGRLLVVTLAGWDKPNCTGPRDPQGCTRRGDWSPQAPPGSPTVADQGAWPWKAAPGPDGRASFSASQLPVLLTFDGPPSLATVRVVDAAHLDAAFGPGVLVRSVVVQQTADSVTRGVAAALPFLATPDPQMQECILADPPPNLPPGAKLKNPDLGDCVWNSLFTQ
jgi:hypothetical protein